MGDSIAVRHLALRVRDVAQTRRFYEQGLGFGFVGFRPSGQSLDLSDGQVNITLLPYVGPEREPLEESFEFIHLGFWVKDLGATYQRLVALNAKIVREKMSKNGANMPGMHRLWGRSRYLTRMAMSWILANAVTSGGFRHGPFDRRAAGRATSPL